MDNKSSWGGSGRGQGMKPLYGDEIMGKYVLNLDTSFHEFLGGGQASPRLRALLEWVDAHQDNLLEDPRPTTSSRRTSYTLAMQHIEIAERLGNGSRVAGVRRAIATAMALQLDLDNLPEDPARWN
jgi:hypothetical protein